MFLSVTGFSISSSPFSDIPSEQDPQHSKQISSVVPCVNLINFCSRDSVDVGGRGGEVSLSINVEETMAVLTRCSFDESHRQPIAALGGIRALADLVQVVDLVQVRNICIFPAYYVQSTGNKPFLGVLNALPSFLLPD